MYEFDNFPELIPENPTNHNDLYADYEDTPAGLSLPRYIPQYKNKRNKLPWVLILVIALTCALLGGTAGAYGVLMIQNHQKEDIPLTDVSYMMQSIRETLLLKWYSPVPAS